VQSGDVTASSAVIWSAADRPARMVVEWATNERFADARRVVGAAALPESGGTAKTVLERLPSAQDVFYRVTFVDLRDARLVSAPVVGRLRTVPSDQRDVTFAWSGDTIGQGWGINTEWGGLRLYDGIRALAPDFFVHCGDLVYADNPLRAEVALPGGGIWNNLVTPEKAKVAETLEEFRGQYRYNLMDETLRRFNAEVAQYVEWDDHDVTDNWFPTRILDDALTVRHHGLGGAVLHETRISPSVAPRRRA
jgi:alkaline phosphatase D